MEDQRAQGGRREKRGRWRREVPVVRNNCDAVPFYQMLLDLCIVCVLLVMIHYLSEC